MKSQRKGEQINYHELSDKEAFDIIFKEMELSETFVKNIYSQKYNPDPILSMRGKEVIIQSINVMFGIIIKEK